MAETATERFHAGTIEERIAKLRIGTEAIVFEGTAAMCEVDIFNSTGLTKILSDHGVSNRMVTAELETLRGTVAAHQGYWWRTEGDAVRYLTPDLASAIRCTAEIMRWVDRHLTEFVKDYVIAHHLLRQEDTLDTDATANDRNMRRRVTELRKIKDHRVEELPLRLQDMKREYESQYLALDREIEHTMGELRGRIPSRGGIAYEQLSFAVAKKRLGRGEVEVNRDPSGNLRYLFSRLTDKQGPLRGQKDRIMVAAYTEIDRPQFFTWKKLDHLSVLGTRFHLYETWGVEYFTHPTFDGILSAHAPITRELDRYRTEVEAAVQLLRAWQVKYREHARPWLDVTGHTREGSDRYKNSRSLMVAAITAAALDEIGNIEAEYRTMLEQNAEKQGEDNGSPYLPALLGNTILTEFFQDVRDRRERMVLAALTYSNGGALTRANSETPKYPTRKLTPFANQHRIINEREDGTKAAAAYDELNARGVPALIRVQDMPITHIQQQHGYGLAMETMLLRMAVRYVHHRSDRPWKLAIPAAERAIAAIDGELSDVVQDGRIKDPYFALVKDAFLRTLGMKLPA